MKSNTFTRLTGLYLFFLLISSCNSAPKESHKEWKVYGGSKTRIQYSALGQIDTSNVQNLQVAWEYHTNDAAPGSQIQSNCIVVDGALYGVSPSVKLFAIDATTGKEKWVFDPFADTSGGRSKKRGINNCRGATYYHGENNDSRIFYGAGSFLYCIDIRTGKPVREFGNQGSVDLHNDLGRDVSH